ncbi:hypothetical protein CEY00_Acc16824 [Actinidia chinensis var. chinensis]|uniref:Uncharacterized protein n=1 Tax=Actinidia chinensis var. chinensis TaxID=1590841 RepID=A0A2R6QKA4_ACTCC|nr:hypothetical protein CEY00_Acc16824 [Actinidia chinensis var. chinensis]
MGKQTKTKKPESYGKGHVTPVQIAFIVDRYLSDNNYSQTRSTFRSEASQLISRSPVQEAPKSLLSLGAILDEYIQLKGQKVMLDQEKCRLEHEKLQVQTLLRGLQVAMNAYNAGGSATTLPPSVISPAAVTSTAMISTPAVYPVYNTPATIPASRPSNTQMDPSKFSTPIPNQPDLKRKKGSKEIPEPVIAKRTRNHSTTSQLAAKGTNTISQSVNVVNNQENTSPHCNVLGGSPVQGSGVAKCLFNQPSRSPPTNLSVPKTPLRATSSQTNKSTTPPEESSTATSSNEVTPQQTISKNCIVISSETIRVSPAKQLTYLSVERNHCISVSSPVKANLKRHNKRDHVKGRLDFDGSGARTNSGPPNPDSITVSESGKEEDIFDLDLSTLDALGADFSLGELLVDFNFDGEFSCQPDMDSFPNSHSGSPDEPWNVDSGANQVLSELSSTVTEFFSEKDMNVQGPESVTSVKSTTKCIKILSPAKNYRSSCSDQENLSARS